MGLAKTMLTNSVGGIVGELGKELSYGIGNLTGYNERLLKEKNENGIGLHEDNIEEIERKKAINRMNKLQNYYTKTG